LASIFFPVEEEILSGRRRPLRISSKAWVMTSDEVRADLESQTKTIKNKGQKTAPRKKRKTMSSPQRLETSVPDNPVRTILLWKTASVWFVDVIGQMIVCPSRQCGLAAKPKVVLIGLARDVFIIT
jgi:hypothetical protein